MSLIMKSFVSKFMQMNESCTYPDGRIKRPKNIYIAAAKKAGARRMRRT
jgi:hypothetical protein